MTTETTTNNGKTEHADETTPAAWRDKDKKILEALLEHVPREADLRPWQAGHGLHIQGLGGVVSKERRHFTILGHGTYANHIGGCRTLVADRQTIRTTKDSSTSIGRSDNAPDVGVPWGRDSLTVDGDAEITFGSRLTLMSGFIERNWNGGVMRLASMEGVICGGAFLRLIASPSATLSGLMTGDVYGGCARAAVVRSYLAVLHYRAAQAAAWKVGLYSRNATFVVEPLIGSPSAGGPVSSIAAKLARLGKVLSVARMVCPPLDIFIGVLTVVPMGIYALFRLISGVIRKPNPIPPAGPPRVRNRNRGLALETFSSQKIM